MLVGVAFGVGGVVGVCSGYPLYRATISGRQGCDKPGCDDFLKVVIGSLLVGSTAMHLGIRFADHRLVVLVAYLLGGSCTTVGLSFLIMYWETIYREGNR